MNMLRRFFRDERGLELSEYAIMAALVILLAVAVIMTLGNHIKNIFTALAIKLGAIPTA